MAKPRNIHWLQVEIASPRWIPRGGIPRFANAAVGDGFDPQGSSRAGDDWEAQGDDWEAQGIISGRPRLLVGLGHHPDSSDARDYTINHPKIKQAIKGKTEYLSSIKKLPPRVDVRAEPWPVEDQGPLHSCTAHAAIALMEYMIRRGCDEEHDLSRLFLYKVTRRLLMWSGDSGAYLRTTMKAAGIFGVPPESYWPYDISRFEIEPDGFLYSFGSRFRSLLYARLDPCNSTGAQTLDLVKRALADKFPVVFGFPVYSSLASDDPQIREPDLKRDVLKGSHAVLAVGYDEERRSLTIRNSWGSRWGDGGYGYLPYAYVENQWASDFWTLFKQEWIS